MAKNLKISKFCFFLLLFIFFFFFFSQVHPLLPFDTDDWMYNGLARPPYPSFSRWNPSKLLPECLQSLTALFGAFFIKPIVGDYILALVYANAFVVSIFIIGYLYSLFILLNHKYSISIYSGFCIITIFVLLHFLALKTKPMDNEHLWYSRDVTCFYHYIIPNMLCASLIMWLINNDYKKLRSSKSISVLAFITFMAVFSNLYSTILLVAYIGANFLFDIWEFDKKQSKWLSKIIKQNIYPLCIIFCWLVVQYFEANGNRATSYGYMFVPFKESLKETIQYFLFETHYNIIFLVFSFCTIVCANLFYYTHRNSKPWHISKLQKILIISMLLSAAYLLLLSSRVFPWYILKADVIFSYLFFYLLLFALCFTYLCSQIRTIRILCPFLVYFFFFIINTEQNTFKDVQYWNGTDLQTCEKFDRDVIDQLKKAEASGMDTVIIYVHKFNEGSNWPQNLEFGQYVGLTLHKHGILRRKITTIYKLKPAAIDR
jgi:hypothetical protein